APGGPGPEPEHRPRPALAPGPAGGRPDRVPRRLRGIPRAGAAPAGRRRGPGQRPRAGPHAPGQRPGRRALGHALITGGRYYGLMLSTRPPLTKALLIANGVVLVLLRRVGDGAFAAFMLLPLGGGSGGLDGFSSTSRP